MSLQLSGDTLAALLHGIVIGGIIAVRYLWPLWLLIIALWLVTKGLRLIGHFFGIASPPPRKPVRPRR